MELLQIQMLGAGKRKCTQRKEQLNYVRPEKEEGCRGKHLLGHRALPKLQTQVEEEGGAGKRKGCGQWRGLGPMRSHELPERLPRGSNLQLHLSLRILGQTSLV